MIQIIYGTGNQAKVNAMKNRLAPLGIDVIGLKQLNADIPNIIEDGTSPLQNACKKAVEYYKVFKTPIFSCDSGLYFDNLPDELQPKVNVRTINGKYCTDDEMIEYYSKLAEKCGDITARYKNAICLIIDNNHIYSAMDSTMESEPFILTSKPHQIRKNGFPLDSLSKHIASGKYYYDLDKNELDKVAVEDGFLEFFKKHLNELKS